MSAAHLQQAMGKVQTVKGITRGYADNLLAEAIGLIVEHLQETAPKPPPARGRFVPSERADRPTGGQR
jgi:hypothetical protein